MPTSPGPLLSSKSCCKKLGGWESLYSDRVALQPHSTSMVYGGSPSSFAPRTVPVEVELVCGFFYS